MSLATYRNGSGSTVVITYFVDPDHFSNGCPGSCSHAQASAPVPPGARFTFETSEENGTAIQSLAEANLVPL